MMEIELAHEFLSTGAAVPLPGAIVIPLLPRHAARRRLFCLSFAFARYKWNTEAAVSPIFLAIVIDSAGISRADNPILGPGYFGFSEIHGAQLSNYRDVCHSRERSPNNFENLRTLPAFRLLRSEMFYFAVLSYTPIELKALILNKFLFHIY